MHPFVHVSDGLEVELENKNLPANAVLGHGPLGTPLAVEDVVGIVDVVLELPGDLPLAIVGFRGRHGDLASWGNFLPVGEDLLAPPLDLLVRSRGEAANEGACLLISFDHSIVEEKMNSPVAAV